MRASLTVGGIEVALAVPAGAVEATVARRYAPFLGAIEAPVCTLLVEANRRDEAAVEPLTALLEQVGETRFRIDHPRLFGVFDLAGTGVVDVGDSHVTVDYALRLLFSVLAPSHDALLLHGTSVISNGGAHVFVGAGRGLVLGAGVGNRPILTDGLIILNQRPDGWTASSTPFWTRYEHPGPPRESKVAHLWYSHGERSLGKPDLAIRSFDLANHVFVPTTDEQICRRSLELSMDLERSVPVSELVMPGGSSMWAQIDAALV